MDQKIQLKRTGFGKNTYPKVIDIEFSQLIESVNDELVEGTITPKQFFEIYDERFYEMPIEGEYSHKELIRRSTEYVGISTQSEEVELLLNEINDLRMQLLENQKATLELSEPNLDQDNI
tara:strand:+ start:55 stop:414 length:360 start_codon:yes stop_codon:yes gene_type:complete